MIKLFKFNIIGLICLLGIGSGTYSYAEPTQANLQVAVIKNSSLENCLYFKDLRKKWEKEFSPRAERIQVKQKEFDSKKDLFNKDKAVLSDQEKISKERELTRIQQELQHMYETLDSEVKSKQQEDLINFNKFVDQVLADLAKEKKMDLILSDQAVLFSANSLDLTDQLIMALDQKFKNKK